jgi:pimeloyl-ACP methyl ester carboxylesterase
MTPIARDVFVDGIRVHLLEAGEGPALVLLHGLSATHANWEHTIAGFADRFRVIAPDLPGHGRSEKPDAPYTIDFYAGIVRSLGHALGIPEAIVAGNSLGGQIAVEVGAAYPAWTRAVVLVAPAGTFGAVARRLGRVVDVFAGPRLLRLALPRALERSVHDPALPGYEARRRLLAERLAHEDYPRFARAVRRSIAGALAAGDEACARLAQPTLVVWGREDRIVPVVCGEQYCRFLPNASLLVLGQCGHQPGLEQPDTFASLVDKFLSASSAAGSHGVTAR